MASSSSLLTFVIHLIGTLAYAVRIAGTRTRRVALSLSLFNVLILLSRTSNTFQAPLLAKRVETNLAGGAIAGLEDFRWLLLFATAGTAAGALLIPSAQRLLSKWVLLVSDARSPRSILKRALSRSSLSQIRTSIALPSWSNVANVRAGERIPWAW